MPSLKEYRLRIASVTSTRKITSAMKVVAASKLKRAQDQAEAARPYADRMGRIIGAISQSMQGSGNVSPLMSGTGRNHVHLLIVISSDRGLCGGFNSALVRDARRQVTALQAAGKEVRILTVGRKGREMLKRDFAGNIVDSIEGVGKKRLSFSEANAIAAQVFEIYGRGEVDIVTLFYNRFKSVISQVPTQQQLIPFMPAQPLDAVADNTVYEFEPGKENILAELLPKNVAMQVYKALMESAAGEQGARMAAMDNASRNAGDMIKKLTLTYNRARQANITRELIEIISGAEAL